MTHLLRVIVLLAALVFGVANAIAGDESYLDISALDSACTSALRITEQQLVEGPEAWSKRAAVQSIPEAMIVASVQPHGQTSVADAEWSLLGTCDMTGGVRIHIVIADVEGRDINRAIYLITERESTILSSARCAWLTTSCSETRVGLPTITDDGRLQVQSVRHTFDCDTDAVLGTDQLPGHVITLLLSGKISQH